MSNFRLALLVGVALLLVVIFGRNPADEVRKRKAERAGQKLVEKIEEANKQNKSLMPSQPRPNFAGPAANRNNNAINPQQNKQNIAPPKDEYYPPAPKNPNVKIPLSSLQNSRNMALVSKMLKNPNLVTDDGKDLAFWGTKVYTYDNDGKLEPIADGKYPMYDGKWIMVVRGGEQTIANGDMGIWHP